MDKDQMKIGDQNSAFGNTENKDGAPCPTPGSLFYQYSLTYDEAFEAFFLLTARGTKKIRKAVAASLLLLATVLTVLYAFYPYYLEYFFLAFLSLASFGGVIYYPRYKAGKGAKNIVKIAGLYQVELLPASGEISLKGGRRLALSGDKDARAFETESVFVIRPDRNNTFCLPKRIMAQGHVPVVRAILSEHIKKFKIKSGQYI